jgi:hypothetical protein
MCGDNSFEGVSIGFGHDRRIYEHRLSSALGAKKEPSDDHVRS